MQCPLCRAAFDKLFIPAIDKDLQKKISGMFTKEYEEAKSNLIKAGQWRGNKIPMRFAFGNTHEVVPGFKPNFKSPHTVWHKWGMFLCLNNDKKATQKFIKKVTYTLHSSYNNSRINVVETAPFLLTKMAWGYFEIQIEVEF